MKAEEEYKEFVDGNVELLVKRVEQHPDTMFYFFLSALFYAVVGQYVQER